MLPSAHSRTSGNEGESMPIDVGDGDDISGLGTPADVCTHPAIFGAHQ